MRFRFTLSEIPAVVALAATCLIMLSANTHATILNVPADHSAIQAAIDAAVDNDTVLVAPGTYYANISFKRKDIVVTSRFMFDMDPAFIMITILNGSAPSLPDSASVVRITGVGDSTTILQGFTITGGKGTKWPDAHPSGIYREGGGVLIDTASPTIQYNLIMGNEATNPLGVASAGGGGLRAGDASSIIRNNMILNNKGRYGGGIVLNFPTGGRITNNVISGNSGGEDYGGGGVWINAGSDVPIINNTIANNKSAAGGGGIQIWGGPGVTMKNTILWGNTGLSQPQIAGWTTGQVSHCDIQGGFAGTGNINVDPFLYGTFQYHMPPSPCTDVGDPTTTLYDDVESPSALGSAKWPSRGLLRNDIGAYGGPYAFSFEKILTVLHNNGLDGVPCTTNVEAYTAEEITDLHWDFGDGIPDYNLVTSHVFPTWGGYPFALKGDTGLGTLTTLYLDTAYAMADSMKASTNEAEAGQPVAVEIFARNAPPLYNMIVPIEWSGDLELQFDSASRTGCRTSIFNVMSFNNYDPGSGRISVRLQNSTLGTGPELGTGAGPVLRYWFTVSPSATPGQTASVSLAGFGTYQPVFKSLMQSYPSTLTYRPEVVAGAITARSCCYARGDANSDQLHKRNVVDLVFLVGYIFQGSTDPPCYESADVNGDILVNIVDITDLVQFLFNNGPQPPAFP